MNMPRECKDYTGLRFGKWTIIERDLTQKRPCKIIAKCDCGTVKSCHLQNLTRGFSTQCMTCQALQRSMHMIGNKYNHITVLSIEKVNNEVAAKIRCDCGKVRFLEPYRILNGAYKSCGYCKFSNEKRCSFIHKIGDKIGLLTILDIRKRSIYFCKCDCGNLIETRSQIFSYKVPSCGCYWENIRIEKAKKYIGLSWGKLKVIKFLGMKGDLKKTRAHYLLKCKCGNTLEKSVGHMFDIRSCGCLHKENILKGNESPSAKTNKIEVATVRELFKTGVYSRKDLSEMTGISYSHLCSILKNKSWHDV